MIKVLIVEDEMLVRIGLKSSIDWAKLDMQIIGDVSNGQSAWEVYEQEAPDLILTDIKMPIMDGIQLIKKIREQDSNTKIIILTCYEEFDMVRKALTLGVSDYILKLKMSTEEMESVLIRVGDEIKKLNLNKTTSNEDFINVDLKKEDYIKDYMVYRLYSDKELERLINNQQLRIKPQKLIMCLMKFEQYKSSQNKLIHEQEIVMRQTVLNIINELLSKYQRGEIVYDVDNIYMIIFSFWDLRVETEIHELLQNILIQINNLMKTYINNTVIFGISGIYNSYPSLREMYKECKVALEQKPQTNNEKYLSKEIVEAIKFIEQNYNTDITLQQVAELVEMSPNYLSTLFKKDLQLSFVEFINQCRVDKAKEMLLNTHMKSYEVAQSVGFMDESYFSRIFKKFTDTSPKEFRKQRISDYKEDTDAGDY
jgi:two-component system response regulator YesN